MVYSRDIAEPYCPSAPHRRSGRRGLCPTRACHKFSRLEALESRLLFNTGLDAAFGAGGRSKLDVANLADVARAVHVLPDGKILLAGTTTAGLAADLRPVERAFVARLTPDGALDASFGESGIVTFFATTDPTAGVNGQTGWPVLTRADALAVGPDGRVFVGGASFPAQVTVNPNPMFAVAALTASGAADNSYGNGGVATADMVDHTATPGAVEFVQSLAVQPDGKLVAVGRVGTESNRGAEAGVVRFDAAGAADATFTTHVGHLTPGTYPAATSVAIHPDGKVVVAETRGSGIDATFAVARYHPDGTPDAGFGAAGRAVSPVSSGFAELWAEPGPRPMCDLLVQPDGKVVVAGRAGATQAGVVRYNADGTPDGTFGGGDGSVLVTTGPLHDVDVELAPAGGGLTLATVGTWGAADANVAPLGAAYVQKLQAFVARFDASGAWVSSARANPPAAGTEDLFTVTLLPGGKLLAGGAAYPTANRGEGVAWDQTADALAVAFEPAAFTPDAAEPTAPDYAAPTDPVAPPGLPVVTTPPAPNSDNDGGTTVPPFEGKPVVTGGRFYQFKAAYHTADEARSTQLGLYGPGGLVGEARLLRVRMAKVRTLGTDVRPAVASYRAAAPGGRFDAADNGPYAVRLGATAAEPSGQVVGQFTVSAPVPRTKSPATREFTGVLRADLHRLATEAPHWRLERPGRAPLVLEVTGPVDDRFAGQPVTVAGQFKTVPAPQGGKSKVFVVTSIRAAAP